MNTEITVTLAELGQCFLALYLAIAFIYMLMNCNEMANHPENYRGNALDRFISCLIAGLFWVVYFMKKAFVRKNIYDKEDKNAR